MEDKDSSFDESVYSSPAKTIDSMNSDDNKDNDMEEESVSKSEKDNSKIKPKLQKSPKPPVKKNVVKCKENIFKRLSIASITKGSRPPKTKKVKEKPSEVHEDDDDEQKLIIDIPVEEQKSPATSQKGTKVKRLSATKKHKNNCPCCISPPLDVIKSATKKMQQSSFISDYSDTPKSSSHSFSSISNVIIKSENGVLVPQTKIEPFLYGWKREVVMRATLDPDCKRRAQADIYYFNPKGKKLRSMPEIISHLRDTKDPMLTPENFTFLKESIYTPPMEIVRQAKQRPTKGTSSPDMFEKSFPKVVKKKSSPKLVPTLDGASPITPVSVEVNNTNKEVKVNNTNKEVKVNNTNKEVKANNTNKEAKANNTNKEVKANNTNKEVKANNTNKEVKVNNTNKEVKANDTNKEGNENSTPVLDPNAPLGKRGRKIKSLPPDFMSPDDVSRRRLTASIKSSTIVPAKPTPLKHSEVNAEASKNSTEKPVKKAVKRKMPAKPKSNLNSDTTGSPPTKKMAILTPNQIKKEVLSASDSEKSPAPHCNTPESAVFSDNCLSPQKDDVLDGGKTRPKVCFTFGKLNKIPNIENNNNIALSDNNTEIRRSQVIPFKKRRVTCAEPIKVSQNDRMCSLTCPGRQCQLPTLHCHICLCLFHPECVGFLHGLPSEEFKCQRCLYQPYLKASEPKQPVICTEVKSPKESNNIEEDEQAQLDGSNMASSDDDENFLTAPPEQVLDPDQLAKDPSSNLTIDDITARPVNANDLAPIENNEGETQENGSNLVKSNEKIESELTIEKHSVEEEDSSTDKTEAEAKEKPVDSAELNSVSSSFVTEACVNNSNSNSSSTINTNPLESLACMVSASNSALEKNEETISAINSNGVPLIMPLMSPPTQIPGQLGPLSMGPLQIPGSIGALQLQQQMMTPLIGLPTTSNSAMSLQIPRPGLLGNSAGPFAVPAESLLGTNNQKPTIPVNLLPNAAPIVVGNQVLTPVSINLTGIAKGTLIYTNNPTLRFLLPSSSGLASFGVAPGIPSLGNPCSASCIQNSSIPISNETLQNSSAVLSQFLPVTPPVQVINVKEHSLCDLMLKIPMNDGHLFSPKVIFKSTSNDEPSKEEVETQSGPSDDNKETVVEDSETQDSKKSDNQIESSQMDPPDIDTVVSIMALNEPNNSDNIDKTTIEDPQIDNQKDEIVLNQLDELKSVDIEGDSCNPKELFNEKIESQEASNVVELDMVNTDSKSPVENETKIEEMIDEFADITGPVLSPRNPVFEDDELYTPVDIESLNWWLSESENEDGKREEEPEGDYRPSTPIVLSEVEFDGSSRIITTRLANKGANVSADSDSCARFSKYKRPVQEFMRNEEHSYNLRDQNHIFRKKKVVTLKMPRSPYKIIQSAAESINLIFEHLNIPDLLNAGLVCKTWKKFASQSHLWSTVKLKGVRILDWKLCTTTLEQRNTSLLDMRGLVQRADQWHDFLASLYRLRKVQGIVFGEVPAWVITSVVNGLPDLLCLEAEEIVNDSKELVYMDPGVLAQLQQMNILRIRAPDGMLVPESKLYGGLSSLGLLPHLTHLSLTSLRKLDNDDVVFLEHLPHLQVLEIGQCRTWTELAYHRLGKLRSLRRLRLEMGGAFADRGLANALIQMSRLQELTLLAYRITSSMAASIRRLRHLWHLTIWPDMSSEGAMVVYNTLQAVRNLKRLQSFSWGIIYQDDTSTRYSRKHGKGKYREASEVDEWWSEELRNTPRAKGIKIPMLKAFSETTPESGNKSSKSSPEEVKIPSVSPSGTTIPGMELGLIGVGHLRQKLQKLLTESEIYVYQVPESLLSRVYGGSSNIMSVRTSNVSVSDISVTSLPADASVSQR